MSAEAPNQWLCDEVFGFAWALGTDIEVRALGANWSPQVWQEAPVEVNAPAVLRRRSP